MKILNASHKVISIMLDNGNLLTVAPGEVSMVFIASRNIILSAMNCGRESEIGIILGGTYEQGIAQAISGSAPYCYLSEDEAKAKLLDPSIDYKKPMIDVQSTDLRNEITRLKEQIESITKARDITNEKLIEANNKIKDLESDSSTNMRLRELLKLNEDLKVENTKLKSVNEGLSNDKNSYYGEIQTLTAEKSALIDKFNLLKSQYDEAIENLNQLKADSESNSDLADKYNEAEGKIQKLKEALSDADKRIESMRNLFNKACEKYNLVLDENGEWQMKQ